MAINCPRCGAEYDVTLFQFGHRVRCDCGTWVELAHRQWLQGTARQKGSAVMAEQEIGRVCHYSKDLGVASVELTDGPLAVGDRIHIHGYADDIVQTVDSIELDGKAVQEAEIGQTVGIRLVDNARVHDVVYRIVQESLV
jgi:translation initiation factor IF-2